MAFQFSGKATSGLFSLREVGEHNPSAGFQEPSELVHDQADVRRRDAVEQTDAASI